MTCDTQHVQTFFASAGPLPLPHMASSVRMASTVRMATPVCAWQLQCAHGNSSVRMASSVPPLPKPCHPLLPSLPYSGLARHAMCLVLWHSLPYSRVWHSLPRSAAAVSLLLSLSSHASLLLSLSSHHVLSLSLSSRRQKRPRYPGPKSTINREDSALHTPSYDRPMTVL